VRVPENLPGTDLVPDALAQAKGGRCFLIGDTDQEVERAARELERRFPGWSVVGCSSGYFASKQEELRVIESVNRAKPHLLMLGMGTPKQERFVVRHAHRLSVPLCICVGGLFGYWSGKLIRARLVVRRLRLEWLWILLQQPHKLPRYTVGVALFFARVLKRRNRALKHVESRCCDRR
jgi:exopolysaccharide biosynthesis WecB/TagA/CpsF family protein